MTPRRWSARRNLTSLPVTYKWLAVFTGGLLAILAIGAVTSVPAYADCPTPLYDQAKNTSDMPRNCNGSGSSAGTNLRLVVADAGSGGNSLQSRISRVKIYSTDPTPQLVISGANHCARQGYDTFHYIKTNYRVYQEGANGQAQGSPLATQDSDLDQGNCTDGVDKKLNLTHPWGSQNFGRSTFYVWDFEAEIGHDSVGAVNSFNLNISSGYIAFSDNAGQQFALQNRKSGTAPSDIYIPMGTQCNVKSPATYPLRWFDDDYNNKSVQPQNIKFYLYDQTANKKVQLREYPGNNFIAADPDNDNVYYPRAGPGKAGVAAFTAEPNHKYAWVWAHVSDNNGIQFVLPFDGIYHDVDCSIPTPKPEHAPTGDITSASCTIVSGVRQWTIKYKFSDADGETAAKAAGFISSGAYATNDTAHNLQYTTAASPFKSGSNTYTVKTNTWPGTVGGTSYRIYLRVADIKVDNSHTWVTLDSVAPPTCVSPPPPAVNATCDAISGIAYDSTNPSHIKKYTVTVNGTVFPGGTGKYNANENVGSPAGHGFKLSPGDPSWNAMNKWNSNSVKIDFYNPDNTVYGSPQTYSIGPCADVQCSTVSLGTGSLIVGKPMSTYVEVTASNTDGDTPPAPPAFTNVQIVNQDDADTPVVLSTGPTVPIATANGSVITSQRIDFTPPSPGHYQMTWYWSYPGHTRSNEADLDGNGCPADSDVGYAPFFNVMGGDASAGAPISGNGTACSTSPVSTGDIKSWNDDQAPYTTGTPFSGAGSSLGAVAGGNIRHFVTSQVGTPLTPKALAFANSLVPPVVAPTFGGKYKVMPCEPDYYKQSGTSSNPLSGVSEINSFNDTDTYPDDNKPHNYNIDGPLTLDLNSPLLPGQLLTLRVKGNVYIKSNVLYDPSYDLSDIPRLNIHSTGNIIIDPSVTELHGLYTAQKDSGDTTGNAPAGALTGYFITCGDNTKGYPQWSTGGVGALQETTNYDTCNNKLDVYGAVVADKLRMDRTYGSLIAVPGLDIAADPAETFHYTPELWLGGNTPCTSDVAFCRNYDTVTGLPPTL